MSPRTIGVMGRVLDPGHGLGLYCISLLRNMLMLDPGSRYVIWMRSSEHSGLFSDFANAETEILPGRGNLWWDQVSVPAAARRAGVDLIFNPKFSIPFATRRPCAFVLQDSDWYLNPQNYPWWDNIYIRLLLPLYCLKARRLMVISQFTRDSLAEHGVFRSKQPVVLHASVGTNFLPSGDEAALRSFRLEHDLPESFILTATRAYHAFERLLPYPGGNNERLIRAYRSYREQGGRLPLVVAGRHIEEYLRAQGFTDADLKDIRFIGFVPNARMHLAYQAATFFVLTKLCDSFGLPILEALASGCPAIVPKTCAAPEVAGPAARLIDPYDEEDICRALLELDGSAERRAELRRLGLARAHGFTWPETARRALAVLDELHPAAPELAAAADLAVTRSRTCAH
ncbi:MAG TPA: glycosyltransferase family 1 protein [Steroidobacteraceae bacterium]|nr:glycosyltransferase family 1 protein [Steroidobacteraceae bacterium]